MSRIASLMFLRLRALKPDTVSQLPIPARPSHCLCTVEYSDHPDTARWLWDDVQLICELARLAWRGTSSWRPLRRVQIRHGVIPASPPQEAGLPSSR